MPRFRARAWFVGVCLGGALALVPTASTAAGPGPGSTCAHARSHPKDATLPQLRAATLCLLNNERSQEGLHPLAPNLHLTRMANKHSNLMVGGNCFEHTCAGERPLRKRLKRSGYLAGAQRWGYAEDLGYESTPKQMVARWLRITYDRKSLLGGRYADVGLGLAPGSPNKAVSDAKFVTYTVDLGWREPPA
jgi:uncharacterized protein YkwD